MKKDKKRDQEILEKTLNMLINQENFLKNHTPEEIHDLFKKRDQKRIKLFEKPVIVKKEE